MHSFGCAWYSDANFRHLCDLLASEDMRCDAGQLGFAVTICSMSGGVALGGGGGGRRCGACVHTSSGCSIMIRLAATGVATPAADAFTEALAIALA